MSTDIIDVSADVFARVQKFRAKADIRYYLNGVHIVPSEGGPCLEATDGHRLYVEQDAEGKASEERILSLSAPATLLRADNRVRLNDEGKLGVFSSTGTCLYVQPNSGVVEGKFPDLTGVIGNPDEWKPGLIGAVNGDYLRDALGIPGAIAFWRPRETADHSSIVLFTVESACIKAFGAIMPVRGFFKMDARAAEFLPTRYLAKPEPIAEPVREAA